LPPTPETAPSRRLNRPQVRVIRRVYATGEVTMEALAQLFGVRKQTIEKIVHNEIWREEECSE
jgi:DNA-binding XRE family transcriptional regulator